MVKNMIMIRRNIALNQKNKVLVSVDTKKRKLRENFQMTFAKAITVMSETSKRKVDILEKISTSQVVGSSSNATVDELVGQKK